MELNTLSAFCVSIFLFARRIERGRETLQICSQRRMQDTTKPHPENECRLCNQLNPKWPISRVQKSDYCLPVAFELGYIYVDYAVFPPRGLA